MQFHVQGQLGGMSCPKTIDLKVDLEKTALIRGNQLIGHSNHPWTVICIPSPCVYVTITESFYSSAGVDDASSEENK